MRQKKAKRQNSKKNRQRQNQPRWPLGIRIKTTRAKKSLRILCLSLAVTTALFTGCQSTAKKQEPQNQQQQQPQENQPPKSGAKKGELIYENDFSRESMVKDWVMEGPGKLEFRDGWMHMYSPQEEYHHVFWCPRDFKDSIIVEWEAQNMETDAGLVILFFAARGIHGEDIFDESLPRRNGDFTWYIKDQLRSYHISYYANTPKKPGRGTAHLRKNNQFALVYSGPEGIPTTSTDIHRMRLIKEGPHIEMYIDERKVIDWTDTDENDKRPYYESGKIGFRQMQWTHFRYRNFKVWSIKKQAK